MCCIRLGSSERLKMDPIGPARGDSALSTDGLGAAQMDLGLLETHLGVSRMDLGLNRKGRRLARGCAV